MKKHVTNLMALLLTGMLCIGSIPVYGEEYSQNISTPNLVETVSDDTEIPDPDAVISGTDEPTEQDADSPLVQDTDDSTVQDDDSTDLDADDLTIQDADDSPVQSSPTVDESSLSTPEEDSEVPEPANIFSNGAGKLHHKRYYDRRAGP